MGVSKHYVFTYGLRVAVDHGIIPVLDNLVRENSPNRSIARTEELLAAAYRQPSWRKKLVALWQACPTRIREVADMREYLVYPKRSRYSCSFRRTAGKMRVFTKRSRPAPVTAPPPPPRLEEDVTGTFRMPTWLRDLEAETDLRTPPGLTPPPPVRWTIETVSSPRRS